MILGGALVSVEDILKNFVGILEENFPQADKFRPRDIPVGAGKFIYINDEDVDRHDDAVERRQLSYHQILTASRVSDLRPIPIAAPVSAVDASSALVGETDRRIISAVRVAVRTQTRTESAAAPIWA